MSGPDPLQDERAQTVWAYLQRFHRGQHRAVKSVALAKLTGLNDRQVRRIASDLTLADYPIGSSGDGFFLCETAGDFRASIDWLDQHVFPTLKRRRVLEDQLERLEEVQNQAAFEAPEGEQLTLL